MKHPSRETWMSYLYGEDDGSAERTELRQHLLECEPCRAQLTAWESARQQLDSWILTPRRALPSRIRTWGPLAAAAAVFLAAGLALGRYAAPIAVNAEAIRADLRQEILNASTEAARAALGSHREEIRALLTQYALQQEDRRQEDLTALALALRRLENQQATDSASLRRDLETVAVLTDASFRQTQSQMIQLAGFSPENSRSNSD
jgi:hypothetical protein